MKDSRVIKVRQISQQFAFTALQMHEAVSKNMGLGATDHKYLSFFLQKGSLTAGELAELTGLTTGAVTGLIDRFEKKQLVQRQLDPADRRKVRIVADQAQLRALFEPYYKEFQEETEQILSGFSEEEIGVIETYLLKNIELMKRTKAGFKQEKHKK